MNWKTKSRVPLGTPGLLLLVHRSAFILHRFLRVRLTGEARGAGAGDVGRVLGERVVDELALFEFVDRVRTRGRARGRGAAGVEGSLAGLEQSGESRLDEVPAAVVLRLLLAPDELRRLLVGREDFPQRTLGER